MIELAERPLALVEQDYYRGILYPKDESHAKRAALIAAMTTRALTEGYDVILEGLLTMRSYGDCFEEIVSAHPNNNNFFYFDVSFDETVERTKFKGEVAWTPDDMREWYPTCTPTEYEGEIIVPEHLTLGAAVQQIKQVSGI